MTFGNDFVRGRILLKSKCLSDYLCARCNNARKFIYELIIASFFSDAILYIISRGRDPTEKYQIKFIDGEISASKKLSFFLRTSICNPGRIFLPPTSDFSIDLHSGFPTEFYNFFSLCRSAEVRAGPSGRATLDSTRDSLFLFYFLLNVALHNKIPINSMTYSSAETS